MHSGDEDLRLVSLIVNLVANGMTADQILEEYPTVEADDVRQALRSAAWTSDDQFVPADRPA